MSWLFLHLSLLEKLVPCVDSGGFYLKDKGEFCFLWNLCLGVWEPADFRSKFDFYGVIKPSGKTGLKSGWQYSLSYSE